MTPNPYQAPLEESFQPQPAIHASQFIPRRMEFQGELTRQHHRDAVVKAGIRKEYRNSTGVMLPLTGLFVILAAILVLATGKLDTANIGRLAAASLLFLGGVLFFCHHQRWLVGVRIPDFQLFSGPVQGWIDTDGLFIRSAQSEAYCRLEQLVSCAATHDLWVLSFAVEQTFWQTIPIDSFDDPSLARRVAADLQLAFPPKLAQAVDERKRIVPDQPFRFSPSQDAVRFEGNLYEDSADGTLLIRATRRVNRQTWMTLAILLSSILAGLLVLTGFQLLYVGLSALWVGFLFVSVFFRVWRARRMARDNGRTIAWYSKGWLDNHGYCAMNALGQTRSTWRFFDHYEITDSVIALYPHRSDACCCLVAREQFADDLQWQQATELVQQKMAHADD